MTVSHWLRPHRFTTSDMTADVVIVGAGFVGLSTAYWISEYRPDLKVIVIDKSPLGSGASGRNAGFLTKGSASFYKNLSIKWGTQKALEIFKFAEQSLELVYQNVLKASPEVKFDKSNSLTLFQNSKKVEEWHDHRFDPSEFKFIWKTAEELSPGLRDKFVGAFENTPEYKVNPFQLLNSLKMSLEARKINITENLSAFEITKDGILTETNTIKCKKVVLALNGYLPQFHYVFQDLITPSRAQMLAVELDEEYESTSLHYDSPYRVYWRKSVDKILLIGGMRLLDEEREKGDFDRLSPTIQSGLEEYLKETLKIKYKVINRWTGVMGFTEHELPLVTRVEAPLDAYVVGGFSGHGMGLGFKAAQETAELLTGQTNLSFFDSFKSVNIKL